ncbi:MAG: 50S ribosomal protein L17, partial [Opitutales bacterium]
MRHLKHRNQLGVKKEHRISLMANLAASLIKEGRIKTTLKKAKALRPFAERLVTLAKKGTLHHRRLAVARVRDRDAVRILFDERVEEFRDRPGGYTRIYKIGTRLGDAAEMGIIEWISGSDEGYKSTRRKAKPKAAAAVSTEEKPA